MPIDISAPRVKHFSAFHTTMNSNVYMYMCSCSGQANEAITPSPQPSLSPAAERTEAVSTPSCVSSSDVADEALTNRPQRPASPIPSNNLNVMHDCT